MNSLKHKDIFIYHMIRTNIRQLKIYFNKIKKQFNNIVIIKQTQILNNLYNLVQYYYKTNTQINKTILNTFIISLSTYNNKIYKYSLKTIKNYYTLIK